MQENFFACEGNSDRDVNKGITYGKLKGINENSCEGSNDRDVNTGINDGKLKVINDNEVSCGDDTKMRTSFRNIINENVGLTNAFKEMEPKYEPNFEMEAYRWVVLILFCMYLFLSAQNMTFIQPVAKSITKAFDITNFEVNLAGSTFCIGSLVNFFLSMYFVEKIGLKWSITIS